MLPRLLILCLLALQGLIALPAAQATEESTDFFVARRQYAERASFLFRHTGGLNRLKPGREAVVVLSFDPAGVYQSFRFEERSGNLDFDANVDLAVRRSLPTLPPPPLMPHQEGPFDIRVRVYSGP